MMDLWGMRSTPLLPPLPGPLWPGVVAPGRVLSMGQIELNCVPICVKQKFILILNCLKKNSFLLLNCVLMLN